MKLLSEISVSNHIDGIFRIFKINYNMNMNYLRKNLNSNEKSSKKMATLSIHSKKMFILSRILIKDILKNIDHNYDCSNISIVNSESGKPLFKYKEKIINFLNINISHCDDILFVGVSKNKCGIDCQKILENDRNFFNYFCNENECNYFHLFKTHMSLIEYMTVLWCIKECWIKINDNTQIMFPRKIKIILKKVEFSWDRIFVTLIIGEKFYKAGINIVSNFCYCILIKLESL